MASQTNHDWQTTKGTVLARNCFMFNNPLMSDIKFTCGSKRKYFHAHKYVLATSSPVFYAMFYGVLADKNEVIHLSDAEDASFEQFLRFLYTDECELTPDIVTKIAYQANKYIIPALSRKCFDIMSDNISPGNVFTILETSIQYSEPALEQKCWKFIDIQTTEAVSLEDIVNLNQQTLKAFLKRDTLKVNEVELYKAVCKWIEFQCLRHGLEMTQENRRTELGDALYKLRFTTMSQAEFTHEVSSNGLLTAEESLTIFQKFNGLSNEDFSWKLAKRGVTLLRSARLPTLDLRRPDCSWNYTGLPDRLCFSVDKAVVFHGVHLFGSPDGGKYDVTLEIDDIDVSGTFSSELVRRGRYSWYGFDVMLREPLSLLKGQTIEMVARIHGPPSYYFESDNQPPVTVGLTTITFSNSSEPANGTDTTRGQFCEVILQG